MNRHNPILPGIALRGRDPRYSGGQGRKTKGIAVRFLEDVNGKINRTLVYPRRRENYNKRNDQVAIEKAEAKRNRKARRLMELVDAGGFGG